MEPSKESEQNQHPNQHHTSTEAGGKHLHGQSKPARDHNTAQQNPIETTQKWLESLHTLLQLSLPAFCDS
jgi:hypothetical protein